MITIRQLVCLILFAFISTCAVASQDADYSTWVFLPVDSFNQSLITNYSFSCVPDIWPQPESCFGNGRCVVVIDLNNTDSNALINQSNANWTSVNDVVIDLHSVKLSQLPVSVCLCHDGYNTRPDVVHYSAHRHLGCAQSESSVQNAMIYGLSLHSWMLCFAAYKLCLWFLSARDIENALANAPQRQTSAITRKKRAVTATSIPAVDIPIRHPIKSLMSDSTKTTSSSHATILPSRGPFVASPLTAFRVIQMQSPNSSYPPPPPPADSLIQRPVLTSLQRQPRAISVDNTDAVSIIALADGESIRASITISPDDGLPVCPVNNKATRQSPTDYVARVTISQHAPTAQSTNFSDSQSITQSIDQTVKQPIAPVSKPSGFMPTKHSSANHHTHSSTNNHSHILTRSRISTYAIFVKHCVKLTFLIPLLCFLCGVSGVLTYSIWLTTDLVFFGDLVMSALYYFTYLFGFAFTALGVYVGIKVRLATMGRSQSSNLPKHELVRMARRTLVGLGIFHVICSTMIFVVSTIDLADFEGAVGVVTFGALPFYMVASFGVYNLYCTRAALKKGMDTLNKQQKVDRMRAVHQVSNHVIVTGVLLAILLIGTSLFVVIPYLSIYRQFYLVAQATILTASSTARMRLMKQPARPTQVQPAVAASRVYMSQNSTQ